MTGPTSLISMTYAAGPVPIIDAALYAGQATPLAAVDCATNEVLDCGPRADPDHRHGDGCARDHPHVARCACHVLGRCVDRARLLRGGANLRGRRVPSNTGVIAAESTVTTLTGGIGRIATVDSW